MASDDPIDVDALLEELEEKEVGEKIESLPDRPLTTDEVEDLNDHDDVDDVDAWQDRLGEDPEFDERGGVEDGGDGGRDE